MISHAGVSLAQSPAVAVGGRQRHDGVKVVIETASVLAACAVGQIAVAAGKHRRAQQQRLHARGEHRVARVDGILAIAQLVREADLPMLGMSLLGTIKIGDPQRRTVPAQYLGDHIRATAAADHVDHHVGVLEHPVPAAVPVDAHAGFVRVDHPRTPQSRENGGDTGIEPWLATTERGIQRPLADRQTEQLQQQPAQSPVADGVHEAQIHRQRHDVEAERGARLQSLRHRRQRGGAAAPAAAGISLHSRHHRSHARQLDLVVARVQPPVVVGECRVAVPAASRFGHHHVVRVRRQRPPAAVAAETALARPHPFGLLRPVRLLPLRRRHTGIARRLRRLAQLGFQRHNPLRQRPNLRPERKDQRVLLIMRQPTEIGKLGHPQLESRAS